MSKPIANYFNKLQKDGLLPISWNLALKHQQSKQRDVLDDQKKKTTKNEWLIANCAQRFFLEHRYGELVVFVSWFSYHCCLFSYMMHPYSLIHVVSSDDPRRWKGTLLRLPLPSLTTSATSGVCLSFIHQQWQATMTAYFWSQLIRVMQQ